MGAKTTWPGTGSEPGLPVLVSDLLLRERSAHIDGHSTARAWLVCSLWCPGLETQCALQKGFHPLLLVECRRMF